MSFMESAAELVQYWKEDFDVKLLDAPEGELIRRIASKLADTATDFALTAGQRE